MLECPCGADLRSQISEASAELAWLAGSIVQHSDSIQPSDERKIALDTGEAALITWFLASQPMTGDYQANSRSNLGVSITSELLKPLANIISDWPASFNSWLDDNQVSLDNKVGIEAAFGLFPAKMRKTFRSCGFPIIEDRFRDYISTEWSGILSRSPDWSHENPDGYLRLGEATRKLNMSSFEIALAVDRGELNGKIKRGGGRFFGLITTKSIDILQQERQYQINHDEAAKLLGIGRGMVGKLVRAGIIQRSLILVKNKSLDTRHVLPFVSQVSHLAKPISTIKSAKVYITIDELSRNAGYNFAQNISAIIDRRVDVYYNECCPDVFSEYLVDTDQLERHVKGLTTGGVNSKTLLGVGAAAKYLNVGYQTLTAIVSASLLTPTAMTKRGATGFLRADLAQFKQLYLFARDIRILGKDGGKQGVPRYLKNRGVLPVMPSRAGYGVVSVWSRESIAMLPGVTIVDDPQGS